MKPERILGIIQKEQKRMIKWFSLCFSPPSLEKHQLSEEKS